MEMAMEMEMVMALFLLQETLNAFMEMGRPAWTEARKLLSMFSYHHHHHHHHHLPL